MHLHWVAGIGSLFQDRIAPERSDFGLMRPPSLTLNMGAKDRPQLWVLTDACVKHSDHTVDLISGDVKELKGVGHGALLCRWCHMRGARTQHHEGRKVNATCLPLYPDETQAYNARMTRVMAIIIRITCPAL